MMWGLVCWMAWLLPYVVLVPVLSCGFLCLNRRYHCGCLCDISPCLARYLQFLNANGFSVVAF